jgi:RNA polymerase sigma-70 factor (ECF subfamily)
MSDIPPESGVSRGLLQQARDGDQQACEELFAGHRDYLRRLVELRLDPRLRARVDASDIVQDAQLEAVRRLSAYLDQPQPMPFRLWLRQIACDDTLKAWRRHLGTARREMGREVRLPECSSLALAQQLLDGRPTPSQQVDRADLAKRLRVAVDRLSDADREVILLRHFEGLSNQEVGALLGIDAATASKRHGRAVLRLNKLLSDEGVTESRL